MAGIKGMVNNFDKARSEGNTLVFFLEEIKKISLLSREDEEKLARQASAGNKAARERLVNSNLRFVVKIARKYQGLGMTLEDLVAEGSLGILKAVDRFDANKNCRFISYAVWWIRQSIINALCERSRMIRIPTNRAVDLIKIHKAKKIFDKDCSTNEEIENIAYFLDIDESRVKNLLSISRAMVSLESSLSRDRQMMLMDTIEDDHYPAPDIVAEQHMMEDDIENVLNTLGKEEADVLRCHFGLGNIRPMSLKEIGEKYNLSKERIRQIEEKALIRLKRTYRGEKLQAYVA